MFFENWGPTPITVHFARDVIVGVKIEVIIIIAVYRLPTSNEPDGRNKSRVETESRSTTGGSS
jgi:hypothetical protein